MASTPRNQPRISVVTPSFNQGEFIEDTLRSVTTQGYPALEYIVIDGGSADESASIIERHEAELAYWVSEPDEGHAHALNKGFAKTTGEIMCWLNSSDMHYPWTLETVAQIFTDLPEVEWIQGVGSWFDVSGRPRAVPSVTSALNVHDVLAGRYLGIQQESVFWRRDLWDRAGGRLDQNLRCAADLDLWLRFFRLAPLCHVQTLLGGFRVHDDQLGDLGNGLYEREARGLYSRFVDGYGRRSRALASLLRIAGPSGSRIIGDRLHKMGLLPSYWHPRVEFDFDRLTWFLR